MLSFPSRHLLAVYESLGPYLWNPPLWISLLHFPTASRKSSYSLSMTVSSPNPWSVAIVLSLAGTGQFASWDDNVWSGGHWRLRLEGRIRIDLTGVEGCSCVTTCVDCPLGPGTAGTGTGCCCTGPEVCLVGTGGVPGPGNEGTAGLDENTCRIIVNIWQTGLTCTIVTMLHACCLGAPAEIGVPWWCWSVKPISCDGMGPSGPTLVDGNTPPSCDVLVVDGNTFLPSITRSCCNHTVWDQGGHCFWSTTHCSKLGWSSIWHLRWNWHRHHSMSVLMAEIISHPTGCWVWAGSLELESEVSVPRDPLVSATTVDPIPTPWGGVLMSPALGAATIRDPSTWLVNKALSAAEGVLKMDHCNTSRAWTRWVWEEYPGSRMPFSMDGQNCSATTHIPWKRQSTELSRLPEKGPGPSQKHDPSPWSRWPPVTWAAVTSMGMGMGGALGWLLPHPIPRGMGRSA